VQKRVAPQKGDKVAFYGNLRAKAAAYDEFGAARANSFSLAGDASPVYLRGGGGGGGDGCAGGEVLYVYINIMRICRNQASSAATIVQLAASASSPHTQV
tara:strand:- start:429 stop:728 length:300 start_codon:yes stop_codon:yes gene_type:complete